MNVVITGASAGIGQALARIAHREGSQPVLVARSQAALEALSRELGGAQVVVADVTQRTEVNRVAREVLARHGHIDVWVNNVGRGISRLPSELTDDDLDEMLRINVKSALYGVQAVLPHFKERNAGQVVNVSSMLGRVPFALGRSAYSASKAFLNSLTANLRDELKTTHPGIVVSLFSPGAVATDFGLNALHGGGDNRALPNVQDVESTAEALWAVIRDKTTDAYSRPQLRQMYVDSVVRGPG